MYKNIINIKPIEGRTYNSSRVSKYKSLKIHLQYNSIRKIALTILNYIHQ